MVKPDDQFPEFVLPGKCTLVAEALFTYFFIKVPFPAPFGLLAVVRVLLYFGFQPGIQSAFLVCLAC